MIFFGHLKEFYGEDLTACFTDAAVNDYRLIRPDNQHIVQLKKLCSRISEARQSKEIGSYALASAYLTELLVQISRAYYDTPESIRHDVVENEKINEILVYINENLTEDLSLEHLAAAHYTSKYYLSRQFKQFTGLSLYQYIMKKRLTVSRNMLRNGSSVLDACFQCGFGDYSNYLKAFKREFGKTPSKYLKV